MRRLGIVVAHPGATSLLFPLVAALQATGHDVRFHTSFFSAPGGPLDRIARAVPGGLGARLRRELGRHSHPDVRPQGVRLHPWREALYTALVRAGRLDAAARALAARNEAFDRAVAVELARRPADLFIGFDGSSLHSIAASTALGIPSLLFQVIGHHESGLRLMADERRLQPAFAATSGGTGTEAWRRRQTAEVLAADHVAVPSLYVRDTLLENGRPDCGIHLLPYPVDTQRFRPREAPLAAPPLRALFAGHIGMRKGTLYVLEALRALAGQPIALDLLGPTPDGTAWLKDYDGLYRRLPAVPHAEMPRQFRDAHVFVFPSLHEGSAMVVNEALASGLPCIVTPNAGSIVRDGVEGFVVPIRDSAAIAERLARLLADPALRARMATAARARAEAHDLAAFGRSLAALVERLARVPGATTAH